MSTPTISLVFKDFAYLAQKATVLRSGSLLAAHKSKPTLHIALLYGEQLRFPSSSEWLLRILSGKAWVSFDKQDFYLGTDDSLTIPKVKNGAIISAMSKKPIFFEVT